MFYFLSFGFFFFFYNALIIVICLIVCIRWALSRWTDEVIGSCWWIKHNLFVSLSFPSSWCFQLWYKFVWNTLVAVTCYLTPTMPPGRAGGIVGVKKSESIHFKRWLSFGWRWWFKSKYWGNQTGNRMNQKMSHVTGGWLSSDLILAFYHASFRVSPVLW